MRAMGNVQENAVQEENVCFDVEMLTPGEAQVEEELRKALVFNMLRAFDRFFLLRFIIIFLVLLVSFLDSVVIIFIVLLVVF
jgi:hypothetical protein